MDTTSTSSPSMDTTSTSSPSMDTTSTSSPSMDTTSTSSHEEQFPKDCEIILKSQTITRFVLLVPLCIFILYQAFQQWRRQRCFSTTSHSDIFTFHNAVLEIFWTLGTLIFLSYYHVGVWGLYSVGAFLMSVCYFGESLFHVLTCVERYLAVVHPVTYRGLKNSRGNRIRDVSIGCVWLLCFFLSFVFVLGGGSSGPVSLLIMLGFLIVVISFCSVSVLCVLIRPRPGDGGGDRERVDQSKLRAFYTIVAILGAIWFWFVPLFVGHILFSVIHGDETGRCVALSAVYWFNLPSSLVLPLLYLRQRGRLARCRGNG